METLTKKTNGKASQSDVIEIKSKNSVAMIKGTLPENVKINGEEKPEVKNPVSPVVENPPVVAPVIAPTLTLDQKIEKVETLKTLIEKREKLEASRKKLTSFVVGANQFSENIVLTDENGNTFKTSNSEVFTKVVETINNTLVSKISEIEKQIEF
ncbi:MAG: hypothetical protein A2W91_04285 [Bacteroidetes bacterium GWF2_38_335]|nr:MAG: hypothetical protein A2W91_04285 [Bacteroidetes bacterium GWF2_38_335]HBS88274.1 hypothetical protein [Bacteroidales bacterium]